MCWLQNTSHHLPCPAYTVLDYSSNRLLYQGKLMFLWSFYIHILKNKQSTWTCVWASFTEERKANEKEKSWAWPQLWELLHGGRSFHFYQTVPSFWLSWAICPWPVSSGAQVDVNKVRPFAVDGISHLDVSLLVCLWIPHRIVSSRGHLLSPHSVFAGLAQTASSLWPLYVLFPGSWGQWCSYQQEGSVNLGVRTCCETSFSDLNVRKWNGNLTLHLSHANQSISSNEQFKYFFNM